MFVHKKTNVYIGNRRIIQDCEIHQDILWAIHVLFDAKMLRNADKDDRLMPQIRTKSTFDGGYWRGPGMGKHLKL